MISCFPLLQGLDLAVAERLPTSAPRPNLDGNATAAAAAEGLRLILTLSHSTQDPPPTLTLQQEV